MGWCTPEREWMLREYCAKFTAEQFAAAWGTTRNAILGRAHRLGISLSKSPKPGKARRREGGSGVHRYSLKIRAGAVAGVLAGASYRKAAATVGVSDCAAWYWSRDPEIVLAATRLLARAIDDARQVRAA